MSEAPSIAIRGLRLAFGQKTVLDGLDLDIASGERLVLIGISGSGKSVLVKCILGLLVPNGGSINIGEVSVLGGSQASMDKLMRLTGVLFQRGGLFDSLPVWQNISFRLIHSDGWALADAKSLAIQKLYEMGLDASIADLFPAELSGGMQKRVALARAMASNPHLLILDDPSGGLDPILAGSIDKLILETVHRFGATTISITHDIQNVHRLADKVAMLHEGRIIWSGRADQVDNSDNPYVDQLIRGLKTGPIRLDLDR